MRTSYFYSLVFALLSSASIAAMAAPQTGSKAIEPSVVTQTSAKAETGKVDLNVADVPTLQRELAGIGESKAKAIVAYRESNGPFTSVDELLEVKGIGKAILERNRDKLEVN
ncbi:ComEA family DNA-binding protein [Pseudomonas prosekii]|uniref:Competence protein ComEA n=1 Tax=Pseudomonas prosekii TaxID=1148509 RepID=A0A2U2DDI4_9PSED|nr:helix-hairpin-helix domain-containing protein [Pseudomonas prosekii]PWE47458.1 competence protein ComEA [Pseudomonas prosekii]